MDTDRFTKPPQDFTPEQKTLYYNLREGGDTYGAAVDTVRGEELMRRLMQQQNSIQKTKRGK